MSRSAVRLRHLADYVVEKSDGDTAPYLGLEGIDSGTGRLVTTELPEKAATDSIVFRPGDVLFGKLRPYLAKSWLATQWGTGSGELMVLRARPGVSSRFLLYSTLGRAWLDWAELNSYGSKMPRTSWEEMADLRLPELDFDEQEMIAEFLDREAAQIDAMIDAQERLLDLVSERRVGMLETFTLPARPVAGSGAPARRIWKQVDVRAGEWDLPLLSVSIHSGVQRRDSLTDDLPRADDLSHYKVARSGDIVINRMRAFQGALGLVSEDGLVSPDYLVLRPGDGVEPEWLTQVLKSPWFVGEMTSRIRGIGSTDTGAVRTPRVNPSDIGEIRIVLPSMQEQEQVVRAVRASATRVDSLLDATRRSISLLRERRAAVITAAVTGRLDPRTGVERVEEMLEGAEL